MKHTYTARLGTAVDAEFAKTLDLAQHFGEFCTTQESYIDGLKVVFVMSFIF